MKFMWKLLSISVILISLSGCSAFRASTSGLVNREDNAYLKQTNGPGLQVPPNLSASKVGNTLTIPSVTSNGPVPASTIPPGGVSRQVPPGYQPPTSKSKTSYLKSIF